jgi:hypothetical protein
VSKQEESRKQLLGRREALKFFGAGITAASGLLALASTPAMAEGLVCKNIVEVDEAGTALRRSSQYKEKSPAADKVCTVCSQFLVAAHGACGGCRLMPGGVNPEGTCLSFAPKK